MDGTSRDVLNPVRCKVYVVKVVIDNHGITYNSSPRNFYKLIFNDYLEYVGCSLSWRRGIYMCRKPDKNERPCNRVTITE